MERRRVNEGSALGTPIDNGQISWNNKLYQNQGRVASIMRWYGTPTALPKNTFVKRVEHIINEEVSFEAPFIFYTSSSVDVPQGLVRIVNGNGPRGADITVVVNGRGIALNASTHQDIMVEKTRAWYRI